MEEAVTAANSNDVIVIKAGNYPIRDKNMTFFSINKAVTIVSESGDPKDVHLHGFGPWNDMKYAGGNFQNNGYKLDHKYAILNGVTLRKFTSDNPGGDQDLALRIVNGLAENVVISNCVGNHKVTGVRLYGGEIRNSLICGNVGRDQDEMSGVDAQGGIVRNCTIRGNSSPGCAVTVRAASAKVIDCQIISNTGGDTNGGGLKLTNGLVENCVISNNTGASAGVYMTGGTLKGCTVTGNTANYARKFGGVNATGGTIEDCTIFANTAYYPDGMQLKMTGGTVKGTTVAAKFDAIPCSAYVNVAAGVTVENCTFQCPSVNGSTELNASDVFAEGDFHIHADKVVGLAPLTVNFAAAGTAATPSWNFGDATSSSEATPSHKFETPGRYTVTLTAGGETTTLDILALSAKTYVGKGSATFPYDTEAKATSDFQAAHDAVYADDTVHGTIEVLADTYKYTGSDVYKTFTPWLLVNKNVTVAGATGNRDDVVFDAQRKIMTMFFFHPKAVLKDLTISNGRFNSSSAYGATLHMMDGFITNCVISKGYANFKGNATVRGGTVVGSVFSEGTLEASGTDRPAGGLNIYGTCLIANCLFDKNYGGYGSGLFLNSGNAIVSNCVIRGSTGGRNGGGGVCVSGGLLTHCVVTNNTAAGTGGGVLLVSGTVRNCIIADNMSKNTGGSSGGGVTVSGGTLENCTVAHNTSSSSTRCDELCQSGGTVRNCIFYGKDDNPANDVYKSGGTATYSSFRKEIAGEGNIKEDPKLKAPASGDYTLLFGSPCIDNGMTIAAVATDILGTPRPVNGAYDMGAYEMDFSGKMGVSFDVDKTIGAGSVTVSMTATVEGGVAPYTYYWTIGGQTYETKEPAYVYTFSYGSHDVTLVVKDGAGSESDPVVRTGLVKVKTEVAYVSNNGTAEWPFDTWEKATPDWTEAYKAVVFDDETPGRVYVADGTYTAHDSDVYTVSLADPIEIIGTNPLCKAVFNGQNKSHTVFNVANPRAKVANLMIYNTHGGVAPSPCSMKLSSGTVTNCVFDKCSADGAGLVTMSGGLLTGCIVRNASCGGYAGPDRFGAGIVVSGGTVEHTVVSNCTDGAGGGMVVCGNSAVVRNCLIAGCKADGGMGGGAVVVKGTLENSVITNCTQTGQSNGRGMNGYISNARSEGGGVFAYGANAVVRNCLIVKCKSEGYLDTGSAAFVGGGAKFYNNTVWSNTTVRAVKADVCAQNACTIANTLTETACNTDDAATFDCCFVAATDGDPLFKKSSDVPFLQRPGSPCVNAGNKSYWDGVENPVDLRGEPRILDRRVDIGCYEVSRMGMTLIVR